jgi:cytochrome b561
MSASEEAGGAAVREAPRYAWLRRMLHWAVALFVLLLVPTGLVIEGYERETVEAVDGTLGQGAFDTLYDLHKSMGLTVLGLMILRVVAKAAAPNPDYRPPIKAWERTASHAVHVALYGLLIVTPIIGWIGVSLYPAPAPFWFLVDLRLPIGEARGASEFLLGNVHGPLASLVGILAIVHVLAAVKHRLLNRDGVWERMLPAKDAADQAGSASRSR